MNVFKRMLSLVLALVLACGALSGVQLPEAAAAETQNLAQLLTAGKIKPLGRTFASGSNLITPWSGCGFEMNVFAPADTTLTVGYQTSYTCMWAVLVDGVQVWRGKPATGTGTFSAAIPYGAHTVSVVKETQIHTSTSATNYLTTMSIGATLQAAPAQKDLYIEFVGDSYTCGDGTMADYQNGTKWTHPEDDSATHGFPWYTAQALNADYSIVARGGIGLYYGTSEQEGTTNENTITGVYQYNAGYNKNYGEYTGGKADIVVIYVGANDGVNSTNPISTWKTKLAELLTVVRTKNPDAPIVCINNNNAKYHAMKELAESGDYGDVYALFCNHHGNGSAALDYQQKGHLSAADSEQLAKEIVNFMRYNNLLPESAPEEPAYKDIVYYVSSSGDNNNAGQSAEAPKLTLGSALWHANTYQTFDENTRLVIKISGEVLGTDGQTLGQSLTNSAGKRVPVLVTTYNYDPAQDNKATLQVKFTSATQDGQCALTVSNNLTLQNLRLESVANANGWAPYNIYAAGRELTFDNVEFTNDGKATTVKPWNVGCVNFATSNSILNAKTTPMYGTVTFLNGDYTNLGTVAAVFRTSIWVSSTESVYALPYYHAKLVVGEGAKMGTVYGRYATMQVGSVTVEIDGGEIASYMGTLSGTSGAPKDYYEYKKGSPDVETDLNLIINGGKVESLAVTGDYVKLKGDVVNTINGGTIGAFTGTGSNLSLVGNIVNNIHSGKFSGFYGTGTSANVTGNVDLNMTGGRIEVQQAAEADSVYLSGRGVVNGNVTNTISGGEIHMYTNSTAVATIMFGGENLTVNGTLTNKISGGSFAIFEGTAKPSTVEMYFGSVTSSKTQLLRNELTGGHFYLYKGSFKVGGRALKSVYGKIENVIGTKDQPAKAPIFTGGPLYLGGNWAQIGSNTYCSTESTQPTTNSDTVVLSNTFYGGYFEKTVYCGHTATTDPSKGYYEYIKGSIENNIYAGMFVDSFCGAPARGKVFGRVTNNIYGGYFANFYAGGGTAALIYDGVETYIYGMEDYQLCANNYNSAKNPEKPTVYNFYAGNYSGGTIAAATAGRPAVKLVFAPENPEDVIIYKTINLGASGISGTTEAVIEGGYFPTGLTVSGMTVEDALADGSYCLVDGAVVTPEEAATSVTGAVTVKPVAAMIGETIYDSLAEALTAAGSDDVVKLGMDAQVDTLSINPGKTLDLNGNELTADNLLCFGEVIDSTDGEACIVMSNDPSKAVLHLQPNNPQLPVYDSEAGGYRFFNYTPTSLGTQTVTAGAAEKFGFRLELTNAAGYDLLADALNSGVSVEIKLTVGSRLNIPYAYSEEQVKTYAQGAAEQVAAGGTVKKAFVLTVSGLSSLAADETLVVTPTVRTAGGVVIQLPAMTWAKPTE